jgi:ubiquinone/menaquinone biosynthesis C-methylase UbiE
VQRFLDEGVDMSMASEPVVALTPDQLPEGWSSHANAYDVWFAPLTARFAKDVVTELGLGPGARVLDVGAGTGSFTIAAARTGADVLATDFAPGMINALRANVSAAGLVARTAVMDGQALDLHDHTFDAAASLLGLVYFPDLAAGARELRRVLRIGGRAAIVTWAPDGFAVQRIVLDALERVLPDEQLRPTTLPPLFRLTDPSTVEMLLVEAGFASVDVRVLEHIWRIPEPEAFFQSLPSWSASIRPVFQRLELELDGVQEAAAAFADLVRERSGDAGLPVQMLLAVGSR